MASLAPRPRGEHPELAAPCYKSWSDAPLPIRLTGVADPLNWQQQTDQSPESMAFVMLLEAAVRDYENPCKAS